MGAYGVSRLEEAGYDVQRLYRGALVTLHRDVETDELERVLKGAPAALRKAALKRLVERGPEAWEARVYAIEGLADVAGRNAFQILLPLTKSGSSTVRVRAIKAIGAIGEAPPFNPCKSLGGFGGGYSSSWEREVSSLGHECESVLLSDEAERLTQQLSPLARDDDPGVREEVAKTLGKIAAAKAIPHLEKLLEDRFQPEGVQTCDSGPDGKLINCRSPYLVREAAQAGLERIAELQKEGVPPIDRTRSRELME
jgi:HEAT repeat protein